MLRCIVILILVLALCSPPAGAATRGVPATTTFPIDVPRVITTVTTVPATVPAVTCQAPCSCMMRSAAVASWGESGFLQCGSSPCEYTRDAAGTPVSMYCFQKKVSALVVVPVTTTLVTIQKDIPAPQTTTLTKIVVPQVVKDAGTKDRDMDSVNDLTDNCPDDYNPDQADSDGDGVGNACDNCWDVPNPEQYDSDNDCNEYQKNENFRGYNAYLAQEHWGYHDTQCGNYPCMDIPLKKIWIRDPKCGDECDLPGIDTDCQPQCGYNEECNHRQCSCKPGWGHCNSGDLCSDLKGDWQNCGACGNKCQQGSSCLNGVCTCNPGMVTCPGSTNCTDLSSDRGNCGSCNYACAPGEGCVQGQCTSLCNVDAATLPSFSWRDWGGTHWMTPVRNQANCGSCWAFGSVGAVEAVYNIEHHGTSPIDLSEQELVSPCFKSENPGSCTGGGARRALDCIRDKGLVAETEYPYKSLDVLHEVPNEGDPSNTHKECNIVNDHCSIPSTCTDSQLTGTRWFIQSQTRLGSSDIKDIKQALLCHGPLVVASFHWSHVVVLVGWDDFTQEWTVKNSWGSDEDWDGYNHISYSGDFNSDIRDYVVWAQGVTGQ
jgi:hypothetical protein